ncbi:MAG: serine hydrolase [Clostridiaceae bacterium]
MKKFLTFILALMIISNFNFLVLADNPPNLTADSAILMDADTGDILYSKNTDTTYYPASITKIMTVLLTLENCNLDDVVTIGSGPPFVDNTSSKIFIFEDEKLTVEDLLYALILASANDCAEALAEHISGTIPDFSIMMNERAKELGCLNTNFVNPHGLYDDTHITTAYDMSLIMKELVKHEEYIKIAQTSNYFIEPTNKQSETRPLSNDDRLVLPFCDEYYPYALAGKTGWVPESLHTYVAYAKKDNQSLILVLMHDDNSYYYNEAKQLFEYGFDNFTNEKFLSAGDIVTSVTIDDISYPLYCDEDFSFTKENEDSDIPYIEMDKNNFSNTYFNENDKVFKANVLLDSKIIGSLNLYSKKSRLEAIPASTSAIAFNYIKNILLYSFYIVLILFLILLAIRFYNLNIRKKRRYKIKRRK